MWPWGHLAVGYLVYVLVGTRLWNRRPTDGTAIVLAVATQFPDLIDKPLAWTLGVLPHGRSLGHSVLVATVVIAFVGRYAKRWDRAELGSAFGIGYLSHLAADGVDALVNGHPADLAYLGWPILTVSGDADTPSIVGQFGALFSELAAGDVPGMLVLEIVLVGFAAIAWARDGFPGVVLFRRRWDWRR